MIPSSGSLSCRRKLQAISSTANSLAPSSIPATIAAFCASLLGRQPQAGKNGILRHADELHRHEPQRQRQQHHAQRLFLETVVAMHEPGNPGRAGKHRDVYQRDLHRSRTFRTDRRYDTPHAKCQSARAKRAYRPPAPGRARPAKQATRCLPTLPFLRISFPSNMFGNKKTPKDTFSTSTVVLI